MGTPGSRSRRGAGIGGASLVVAAALVACREVAQFRNPAELKSARIDSCAARWAESRTAADSQAVDALVPLPGAHVEDEVAPDVPCARFRPEAEFTARYLRDHQYVVRRPTVVLASSVSAVNGAAWSPNESAVHGLLRGRVRRIADRYGLELVELPVGHLLAGRDQRQRFGVMRPGVILIKPDRRPFALPPTVPDAELEARILLYFGIASPPATRRAA